MALTPAYQNIQISGVARLDTLNASYDGTGTLVTLHESPATSRGSLIEQIVIQRVTGSTALSVNLFIDDGTNIRYIDTIALPGASHEQVKKMYDSATFSLPLSPGHILKVSTTVAEQLNVFFTGGIY